MELRQIRYALMVAEEKSFSKAAKRIYISQPSLSQQIIKLEKELGVQLFERHFGKVQLTYAGQHFINHASEILDNIQLLTKEMHDMAEMKRGQLIIGCLPSVGAYILPDALTIFKEQFPNIDLVLVEEAKGKLIDLTLRGQTDISLLSLPIEDSRLEILPLSNEEIVLAVPKNHIFSNKTMITLSECKNESFILLKKGQGFRRIFEELCEEAGYEPKVSQESNNMETLKSLVAAGLGISLMPKMYSKLNWKSSSLVYIPIQGLPPYKLVFSYKKGRFISKITTSFISIMNSIMDKDTFQEDK